MAKSLPDSLPPRGLSREQAAAYFGICASTFDKLVADGEAPHPRTIRGRNIYDVKELDEYFDRLPHRGGDEPVEEDNPFNEVTV